MAEGHTSPAITTPPDPAGPERPSRADAIYAEQVRHLYRLSRNGYAGTLFAAAIVVAALWSVVPAGELLLWAAAVAVVTLVRYFFYRDYSRRKPPVAHARRWSRSFIVGAAAAGALWGALGSLLYPSGSMPQEFLVMLVIAGAVISAALMLAPIKRAFIVFLLPAALPVLVTVFMQGTTLHLYMTALLTVFVIVMLGAAPMMSDMMRESIAMRFENTELVSRLSETHAASRLTNLQLNEQVYAQRVTAEQLRQASQKLGALIHSSPLAIIVRDVEGQVESWNTAAERIYGWTQEEVRGRPVPFYPPEREAEAERFRRSILDGETVSGVEGVHVRKDGQLIDVSVSAALVHDVLGRPTGYLTMIADITERKRSEQKQNVILKLGVLLSEAQTVEEAIPRVLETVSDSFGFVYAARWVLDKQNLLLRCAETWNVPTPQLAAFREQSQSRVERPGKAEGLNRRVWETGAPVWLSDIEGETTLARRPAALQAGLHSAFAFPIMVGGEFYGVMEFFAREVRQPDDTVLQVAQTVSSHLAQFIARKQAERNLQFVASHDALTGLFNRSMFSQRLQQALAQAHRHERRLAVLFIDLDGFKLVNDLLGHDAGDVLLSELANRLRECMREGDTLGRMGGDEFVVLIEGYEEDNQLIDVARKVLETVDHPFLLRDGEHRVTASIGIAAYPQDGQDAADLLKNADIAMYRAKEQGKNQYQFHSPEMNTHLVERVSLEAALRRALDRGELTVFYQPKLNIAERRVTGVEGLVRWLHPSLGVINPPEFVPIAEDAGLFTAIGDWVLRSACAQLRAWQQKGVNGVRIAVNLSMRQFGQENLVERLREAIYSASLDPKYVDLEVTESILMRHAQRAARLLAQIKDLGANVVVDDFGTGYSSLGCLKRFPIDAVKIDRSLVGQLPVGEDAMALTRAVIGMAHSLNLQVTAEGVETRQQWDFLSASGCDAMQGNYFCAPAPAETVTTMLLQQPHGVYRIANIEQFRPWRAGRSGLEPGADPEAPQSRH
jgi:diguanylate cyclase (GGDEF)-like protein/PAS domain S-box-containing protein